VQINYAPVGFAEHGEALNNLFSKYPGDFEAFSPRPIPVPPAHAIDSDGRYYEKITDDWGITQEYRVYGIMGHATDFPIKTPQDADNYELPPIPAHLNDLNAHRKNVNRTKENHFSLGYSGNIAERMWALRGFENFMMDILDEEEAVFRLMDRLTEYNRTMIEAEINSCVDSIAFGDDIGMQGGLVMSKETFRRVIKPCFARMLEPAIHAGVHIHYHSCGLIMDLFDDLKDLGINSLWLQLPVYDMKELKKSLDYYGFSLAIHTDRALTMTHGTPSDVRERVFSVYK